jgi:L-rhamnose-H+ transport protein
MVTTEIGLVMLSGLSNGLFTTPMKLEARWKWGNIGLIFIVVACLLMPAALVFSVFSVSSRWFDVLTQTPRYAVVAALSFGFAWGFGAICFGKSVHGIGVSMANTLVLGLSAALGPLVPLLMRSQIDLGMKQLALFAGVIALLLGVGLCGKAGRIRDGEGQTKLTAPLAGYFLAVAAGVMSAIFNIGYALALPISDAGVTAGLSRFTATNLIWLLMLGAGSLPNIGYGVHLMRRNHTAYLLHMPSWGRSTAMGLLWGGSIFTLRGSDSQAGTRRDHQSGGP